MAEGGGNEGNNPFSYKTFVQSKKGKTKNSDSNSNNDEEEPFDLQDTSIPRRKERATLVVSNEKDEPSVKPKRKDENPFSFKKFLSGSGNSKSSSRKQRYKKGEPTEEGLVANTPDLANDLPDFVQDHFDRDTYRNRSSAECDGLDLPDFTIPSSNISRDIGASNIRETSSNDVDIGGSYLLSHSRGAHPAQHRSRENSIENHVEEQSNTDSSERPVILTSRLPDFLSDGAFHNIDAVEKMDSSQPSVEYSDPLAGACRGVASCEVNGDLELELRRMRLENRDLQRELEASKQLAASEANRVSKLLEEMEKLQKKEVVETAAMESAVQHVEANLVTSTQRAVKAEASAAKLKQEVKSLQNQVSVLKVENEALKMGDKGLADMRERAKYASEQLSASAVTAEQNLRQLMSGVDQLRLLSQVLSSMDKISEESNNNINSNKSSETCPEQSSPTNSDTRSSPTRHYRSDDIV